MNVPHHRHGPKRTRLWPWLAGGAALCLLLAVVLIASWQKRGAGQVESALEEIRRIGEPTAAAELEAFYQRPPPDEDATQLWLTALAPLEQPTFQAAAQGLPIVGKEIEIPQPGQPWNEQAGVEQLLRQYKGSLDGLHQAAARGGAARYPTRFSQGVTMLLPHVQALRQGARLLALEVQVRAHRQDAQGAADSIQAMLRLSESLKNEPLIVSQLVRVACNGMATNQLTGLMPHVDFADADLVRLQLELRQIRNQDGLRCALIGERVIGIETIRDPAILGGGWLSPWSLVRPQAGRIHLEFMNAQLDAARRPWPEALQIARQLNANLKRSEDEASGLGKPIYSLMLMSGPGLEAAFTALARRSARNDATDAAIAVELYRRQHDSLPAQLADLVPEFLPALPLDPFDGQSLRYLPGKDEYLIYNVGPDGVDQGGEGDEGGKPDDPLRMSIQSPRR
jgi:hypothetical protein